MGAAWGSSSQRQAAQHGGALWDRAWCCASRTAWVCASHVKRGWPGSARRAPAAHGLTLLNLTKLDVLSGLDEIRVGVGYRTPAGDLLPCFPQNLELLEACEVGASIV